MKNIRFISFVLIFSFLVVFPASCSKKQEHSEEITTDIQSQETGESTHETTPEETELSLGTIKWNETVSVFTWKEVVDSEFLFEGGSGDVFKEAIYKRIVDIGWYNEIDFNVTSKNGNWDNKAGFIKAVEANQAESEDKVYDIVGCYAPICGEMAVKGFFANLADDDTYKYLKLGTDFWPEAYENAARVNNAIYSLTGLITPTYIQNVSVVHVNLDMLEKYDPGIDIYKLVNEKKWTYEKLEELALGNSTATGDKTEYGFTMSGKVAFDDIFYSAGYSFAENLEDGSLKLTELESDEEFIRFTKYAYSLLNDNSDVAFIPIDAKANATAGTGAGFAHGNVMFNLGNLSNVKIGLTDVSFKVGIIPIPIYETSTNDDYRTLHSFWVTHYSIPQNTDDKELASFALNRLQYYGLDVANAYVDTLGADILTKENTEMIDLICEKLVFDSARIFGTQIGVFSAFREVSSSNNWIEYYVAHATEWSESTKEINRKLGD